PQITGIRDRDLAGAGPLRPAIGELLALARGSIFVAHNAAFDVGMLDRALMRLDGTRIGMRVLDTVGLARRLLAGRIARFDLASVSERFDVTVRPCHRALPGALATLERIETAPTGSELEAALSELELIRRWRPAGNVRDKRPDRAVYLRLALAEHAPALAVREAVRQDGAVYAGPFASRRLAT